MTKRKQERSVDWWWTFNHKAATEQNVKKQLKWHITKSNTHYFIKTFNLIFSNTILWNGIFTRDNQTDIRIHYFNQFCISQSICPLNMTDALIFQPSFQMFPLITSAQSKKVHSRHKRPQQSATIWSEVWSLYCSSLESFITQSVCIC